MRFFPELLAFTDGDVWRPGIGDPTVMGWLTVVAYFAAGALCIRNAAGSFQKQRAEVAFWSVLGLFLAALGINKQLDLQTFLTITIRRLVIDLGWYENRRVFQVLFILTIALAGIACCLALWRLVRTGSRGLRMPLFGFMLLVCFVIIRAASFHHVDALINLQAGGVRMNWLLELGAIAIIAAGAWPRRTREVMPVAENGSRKVALS